MYIRSLPTKAELKASAELRELHRAQHVAKVYVDSILRDFKLALEPVFEIETAWGFMIVKLYPKSVAVYATWLPRQKNGKLPVIYRKYF